MNVTANALLALGASPVMAHAREEVEEMTALSRALVLNIGTLSASWIESMIAAGRSARRNSRPIVLDPVGAGATRFRTETVHRLLQAVPPAIVRGNASEILAVMESTQSTQGVDSRHRPEQAVDAAAALCQESARVVVVSGAVDYIVSATRKLRVLNGHSMMPKVTGLGCTASAFTAAFAAVNPSLLDAAAHAMAIMGIAGEMAGEHAAGPGSFLVNFLDSLFQLGESDIRERLRLEEQ